MGESADWDRILPIPTTRDLGRTNIEEYWNTLP